MNEASSFQSVLGWMLVMASPLAIWAFFDKAKRDKQKSLAAKMLFGIQGFTSERYVLKTALRSNICQGLALDTSSRQICLISGGRQRVIPFEDLMEAEIVVDGNLITKTSRVSQLAGVAVGAALGGGLGALIGGMTGAKSSLKNVNEVTLKLLVNDLYSPSHSVQFIEMLALGKTRADIAIAEAQNWMDTLKVVVLQNSK